MLELFSTPFSAFTYTAFPSAAYLLHSFFFGPFIMEFVALLLLRAATFSDLRKRRYGIHRLKAAEENQPQKPSSSAVRAFKRQYACLSHRYPGNPVPCVLLHDLREKLRDTQV